MGNTLVLLLEGSVVALLGLCAGCAPVEGLEGVCLSFLACAADNRRRVIVYVRSVLYVDVRLCVLSEESGNSKL